MRRTAGTRRGEAARARGQSSGTPRTIDRDTVGIDVYRKFHIVASRHEALDEVDVDGAVREDRFRVKRDHFNLRSGLDYPSELLEDDDAWLSER